MKGKGAAAVTAGVVAIAAVVVQGRLELSPFSVSIGLALLCSFGFMHATVRQADLTRLTLPGVWWLGYVSTVVAPGVWFWTRPGASLPGTYLTSILLTLFTVPLGIWIANAATGFRVGEILRFYDAPVVVPDSALDTKPLFLLSLALALGLTAAYLSEVPSVPLFALIRDPGGAVDLVLLREDALKLLNSPLVYAYDVLRLMFFPFLVAVATGFAIVTRERRWIVIAAITVAGGIFFAALTLAKFPVAILVLTLLLCIYLLRRSRLTLRGIVLGSGLVLAFPLLVIVGLNRGNPVNLWAILVAIFQRLFVLPADLLITYFELVPDIVPFQYGRTVGRIAWAMGEPFFPIANTVFQWRFPTRIVSGSAPAAFIGNLYVDFGMIGVVAGGIAVGVIMQGLQVYLMRRPKTIPTVAALAFMFWPFWQINLSALPRTLLSGGVFPVLALMWLYDDGPRAVSLVLRGLPTSSRAESWD